jgi:two-component system, NtrC family, nitrogen regulation sensor histidine kinase NtrY
MIYKRYYFRVAIRIFFITLTSMLFAFVWHEGDRPYSLIVIVSLLLLQAFSLFRYINRTNIELARFFDALRDKENTPLPFAGNHDNPFPELTKSLSETFAALKDARLEKEKQFQFLKFISDNVGLGILVFDNQWNVVLSNKAISRAMKITSPFSLESTGKTVHELPRFLEELKPGESKVFRTSVNQVNVFLVTHSVFTLAGESLKLYIFQDMKKELEDTEILAWHKLIRVLSHEIMNSVTPVINLVTASRKSIEEIRSLSRDDSCIALILNDMILNNEIVAERMKSLSDFVIRYRNASAIPIPKEDICFLSEIISGVTSLLKEEIDSAGATVRVSIRPENLTLRGDKNLLEHVMINLVKNSIQAFHKTGNGEITVSCISSLDGKTRITISDNGEGIPAENLERVFLPFFTTRQKGTGIGLSLSRQIIRMHGGILNLTSVPGKGTIAEITL